MSDLSELNSILKQLDELRLELLQINRQISDIEKLVLQGITVPIIHINRRAQIQEGMSKIDRMRIALEDKVRLAIRYELSSPEQRGNILLEGARRFYRQFKNNPISDDDSYIPKYNIWVEDLLNEALRIGFHDAEVYFLMGSICLDTGRISDACDFFTDSFELNSLYVDALKEKIYTCRILVNEGDDWRRGDLLRDEEELDRLLSEDNNEDPLL